MLHLFIDSLDECPDRGIGARLVGELRDGPIEKLRLRVACRTAELPQVIENALPRLWKDKEEVGFFELEAVTHPADRSKVAPELRETAAWLASMVPDAFNKIMDMDPQVLLRSDVAMVDDLARERLVRSLLDLIERREALDTDFHDQVKQLGHERLSEQLRPFIVNKAGHFITRRAAIAIAEECRVLPSRLVDGGLARLSNGHREVGRGPCQTAMAPCVTAIARRRPRQPPDVPGPDAINQPGRNQGDPGASTGRGNTKGTEDSGDSTRSGNCDSRKRSAILSRHPSSESKTVSFASSEGIWMPGGICIGR